MKTIRLTPTWEAAATMLCQVLEHGESVKVREEAKAELRRMGRLLDETLADTRCPEEKSA